MPQVFAALAATAILFVSFFLPSSRQTVNPRPFTIIAAGDAMLGRSINQKSTAQQDFTFAFSDTKDLLSSADFTLVNLETPLAEDCPITTEGMVFCADPRHIEGLLSAGVDVVSLANNHAFDQKESGFATTVSLLEKSGIKVVYTGHPAMVTHQNLRISIHGFNDIWSWSKKYSTIDPEQMSQEISTAKKTSDLVIVIFHWGNEYTEKITKRQKDLAYQAIDSGADLIIGGHPHWIQSSEYYKNKYIDYSLGNYIFDQYWSEKTRIGQIAKYTFTGTSHTNTEHFPVYQQTNGHTVQK